MCVLLCYYKPRFVIRNQGKLLEQFACDSTFTVCMHFPQAFTIMQCNGMHDTHQDCARMNGFMDVRDATSADLALNLLTSLVRLNTLNLKTLHVCACTQDCASQVALRSEHLR